MILEIYLFQKKYHAYLIKDIVNKNENVLKDNDIKYLLDQKGIHLSVRTICNCRKLLNIPNYKERPTQYYEKEIAFSGYVLLEKDNFNKIPNEAGVYELSISSRIEYPKNKSNVIYIGSSQNLRKRIANYSGKGLKNDCLKDFRKNYEIFVRFYLTVDCILLEKKLLRSFKNTYGQLPKANSLGG